jgi:hypothetical protein
MSSEQSEPIVNRDAPLPVVSVTGPEDARSRTPNSDNSSRHRLSPSKLKDKLESLGDTINRQESPSRVSDRMFSMYS